MSEIEKIRLFDNQKVRTIWVEEEEEWYFSVKAIDYIQSPEELPFEKPDE